MTTNYSTYSDRIELTVNDKTLFIRRVKRARLKEFIEHYDNVLYYTLKHGAAYGEMFIEDNIYQSFVDLCKMIPVDGVDTGLDFSLIEEEYEFLNKFFVSESWHENDFGFTDTDTANDIKYSTLCKFLRINHTERVGKSQTRLREEREQETQKPASKTKQKS